MVATEGSRLRHWIAGKCGGCLPLPDEYIRGWRPDLPVRFQPRILYGARCWQPAACVWIVGTRQRAIDPLHFAPLRKDDEEPDGAGDDLQGRRRVQVCVFARG